MTMSQQRQDTLHRFFSWYVKRTFHDLSIDRPEVTDHIIQVLIDFTRTDRLYRIRDLSGKPVDTVVEMLIEAQRILDEDSSPAMEKEFQEHIGNYTLFMSGLFRDYVERIGCVSYYLMKGSSAYLRVSELCRLMGKSGTTLFRELSSNFEHYSGALHYMQKVYFSRGSDDDPFEDYLRRLRLLGLVY